MNGFHDYLRGICVLLSDAAACVMVLYLLPVFPGISYVWVPIGGWVLFLMVHFLISLILTGRGISMNGYLVWNGAAAVLGAVLMGKWALCPEYAGLFSAMAAVCVGLTTIHGAYAAWTLPGANTIIKYVDCLVVLLAFYLYAAVSSGWMPDRAVMLLAVTSLLTALAVINQIRTNDENVNIIRGAGAGSRCILFFIILGILVLTGLVTGLASGQIHSAVDVLMWLMIKAAGIMNVVFSVIGTVLAWIIILVFSLFPAMPQAARENAQTMLKENVEEIVEETGLTLPLWFWQLLGAVLMIGAIIGILYTFRNVRLSRVRRRTGRKKAVKKSYVAAELKRLFQKAKEAVIFELQYRKYRRTPAGLLIYADRVGRRVKRRKKGREQGSERAGERGREQGREQAGERGREMDSHETLGRRRGESPGEYMRRLAIYAPRDLTGQADAAESLRRLAVLLDEMYYHGQDISLTREECRKYEEIFNKCEF